jgi:hypothetical protein
MLSSAQQVALKSDSLEVKTRLAKAEYEALDLTNKLATQKEQLNNLLGRDVRRDFRASAVPDAADFGFDLSSARRRALDQRPELRAGRLKVKQAEVDRRIKKSEYIPDVSLGFTYLAFRNFGDIIPKNFASLGVVVKWEVFDWGRKKDQLAEKDKTIAQAKNGLHEAESLVRIDVGDKFRKLQQTRQALVTGEVRSPGTISDQRPDETKQAVAVTSDQRPKEIEKAAAPAADPHSESVKKPRASLRRFTPVLILLLAATILLLITTYWNTWVGSSGSQKTDDAYLRADITPLSTRVSGTVTQVAVADYQKVKAGDLLVQIKDDDYRAQVKQSEAAVQAANAALENNAKQKALQESRIAQAGAGVEAAKADIAQSDATLRKRLRNASAALKGYEGLMARVKENPNHR